MLSIQKVSISSADYYLHLAQEDYYMNGGEPPGQWHGEGAVALGLGGEVTRAQFENLFQGFSPDGKTPLVQNAGQKRGHHKRVPGWDLTFSPPKSVSVCWALASEDLRAAIAQAHEDAVRTALTFMEQFAAITRRGSGGTNWEKAKLCYAMFEHGTSRALDPQLHSHVICFNLAVRADGTTGALRSDDLFDFKMAAGALYRCQLASTLQRQHHLPIEKSGTSFEIKGVNRELMDLFSTRRHEILEYCAKHGIYSAVEAEKAALATRGDKQHVAREILFRQWEEISFKVGWTQSNIAQLFDRSVAARDWPAELEILSRDVELALRESAIKPTTPRLIQAVAQEAQDIGLTARQVLDALFSGLEFSEQKLGSRTQVMQDGFADVLSELQIKTRGINESVENRNREVRADRMKQEWTEAAAKHKANQEAKKLRKIKTRRNRSKRPLKHGKKRVATALRRKRKQFAVVKVSYQSGRLGKAGWSLNLRFVNVEARSMRVFEKAPKWHPFHYLKLPGLAVRAQTSPLKVIRRLSIPLEQTRHAATCQIKEAIAVAFVAGARFVLFDDRRVEKLAVAWGRVARGVQLLKQFRRPRILVAKSDRDLWRGILEEWGRDGLARPDRNLILTQTRAKADRLNRTAQQARIKQGGIGKSSLNIRGIEIHRNDRIRFTATDKWNQVKVRGRGTWKARNQVNVDDVGTVTELKADRFAVRLDSGVTVAFSCAKPPRIALAYAMAHEDARGAKPKRTFILFEGDKPENEYSAICAAAENSRVQIFVTAKHAAHFTAKGVREMKRRIGAERLERHDTERDRAEIREATKDELNQKQSKKDDGKEENLDTLFPDPSWKPKPYAMNDWFVEGTEHLFAADDPQSRTGVAINSGAEPQNDQVDRANKLAEETKRRTDEERRQEELRRQEEELRRSRAPSNSQSHGHSH